MTETQETSARDAVTWEDVATGIVGLGMLLAPMPSRLVTTHPTFYYADLFLVLGLGMLFPTMARAKVVASGTYLIGALVLGTAVLVAFAVHPSLADVTSAIRLLYALVFLPVAMMLWSPSRARVVFLLTTYVVGTAVSVLYGVATGSAGGGRNLGLTLHPNGLGYTCLYSLALLPFLLTARPTWRWPLRFLGLVALLGVWTSGSRGAVITLGLLLLVYIVVEGSAAAILFAWGMAAVVILVRETVVSTGGNNALARLLGGGSAEDATGQREVALHDALDQIGEHPFLGVGFGALRSAHNIYLQIYAALGLLALIGFVLILIALAARVVRRGDPLRQIAYVAVAFVLLGPLSDSVSDTLAWAPLSLCILIGRRGGEASDADAAEQGHRVGEVTLAASRTPDRRKYGRSSNQ